MIQPKIQEIEDIRYKEYLAYLNGLERNKDGGVISYLPKENWLLQNYITFTPEEFEQFKREFGKELLNEVSKNCSCWIYNEANGENETYPIDLEEILPALDDYLLNNKI